jgi:peptidoglycan/LPS O-acetylase OafA/YrhL
MGLQITGGGYVGVDIFFVISGYLISSIILSDIGSSSFSFSGFYDRRIRRIFPALFVVLFSTTILSVIFMTPMQLRHYGQSLLSTVLFVSNFYFQIRSGYFDQSAEELPLLHMWSLSVEEQFYLIFPVILMAMYKFRNKYLKEFMWVFGILSLSISLYFSKNDNTLSFYNPACRFWELISGALVAVYREPLVSAWKANSWSRRLTEVAGAALLVVPIFAYSPQTPFPGVWAIPPVLGSAMLILAANERTGIGRLLAAPPFVGIGLISYSAYLWHQPLFAMARVILTGPPPPLVMWTIFVATFGLAYLSWRFVERPFRDRSRFDRKLIFGLAATLTVCVVTMGAGLHVMNGFPQRFDARTQALAATVAYSPKRDACHTDGLDYLPPAHACRYLGKTVDWASFGDSQSVEIGYALAEHLAKTDHGLVHLSFSGCQPALTFQSDNPGCNAWTKEALSYLIAHREIKNVMITYRYGLHLTGDQTKSGDKVPDEHPKFLHELSKEEARAVYVKNLDILVRRLVSEGKNVYLLLPFPELPQHIDRYIYHYYRQSDPVAFSVGETRDYYSRRNRLILEGIAKLGQVPGVTLIDPRLAVCDERNCHAIIGDQAMYFDEDHLDLIAARRVIALAREQGRLP